MKVRQLLLGGALATVLFSCADRHIYQGDRYYESLAYSKAIPHYEKVYFKKPSNEVGVKLAESYYKTGDLKASEAVYERLVDANKTKGQHYFNYARVLMANGKYEKAKVVLDEYLSVHPEDNVAQMLLSSANAIDERFIDTTLYELEAIESEGLVNAFSVTPYKDQIVFVGDQQAYFGKRKSAWTGNSYLDLYTMEKSEDGTWLDPKLLAGNVNGPFHEGPATFNSDGTEVFFTRSNYFKRKMEVNEERENNLKIFKASLVDGKWTNLEELPFNSDDYSVGHPALTPCCHTLYFVSDMPGGFGGTDIYRSDFNDGEWSEPENLGPDVNTPGNEMFPFVGEDDALYFSSDAHNSMGGLDVFITYYNGERWVKPENLNYPINSNKDDFSFTIDENTQTGFVSSSRSDKDKIYSFNKNKPKFNLFGFAHEKGSKKPVEGVNVEITNSETGEVITATSDSEGKFEMKLTPETAYDLKCTKFGCFSRFDFISTKGLKYSEDFYADFEVEPIVINKPIVLENIYYDFDKWNIRPDAAVELDKLAKLLKDNPEIEIEMGSHTDVRGSDKYNMVLSDRRAYSAVQYLISKGIDPSRLTWKGYGETVLVNSCTNEEKCDEEAHQENRRTEFKVTKIRK
jgi:peptidoglycan-associated lipoprotein